MSQCQAICLHNDKHYLRHPNFRDADLQVIIIQCLSSHCRNRVKLSLIAQRGYTQNPDNYIQHLKSIYQYMPVPTGSIFA